MVRLAGIEPTTLGFGGSDFPLDCGVSQYVFPRVLWGNCGVSELLLYVILINSKVFLNHFGFFIEDSNNSHHCLMMSLSLSVS